MMLAKTQMRAGAVNRGATRRVRTLKVQALFGFGKKEDDGYDAKEEEFRAQQELLRKRRSGEAIKEASERRKQVREVVQSRKDVRKAERDALAQGVMPETLKNWKPYQKKEDAEAGKDGRIVVPLLPFGLRQYDEGERFDLRSPYSDDGWVDPEETDAFAGLKNIGKKLLNLTGKSQEPTERKPIIWASDYEKYKREQQNK